MPRAAELSNPGPCSAHQSELVRFAWFDFSARPCKEELKADGNRHARLSLGNRTGLHGGEGKAGVCQRDESAERDGKRCREKHTARTRHRAPPRPPPPGADGGGPSPYLFRGDHGDHVGSLLPHHLPEVMARVWQGPLGGNVVPFCPANHHLQTKESVGEATLNPGPLPADHGEGAWLSAVIKTPATGGYGDIPTRKCY